MAYMVIYPRGDRKTLSYVYVEEYERADWDLASLQEFDTGSECREYMIKLADRYGLRRPGDTAYLD